MSLIYKIFVINFYFQEIIQLLLGHIVKFFFGVFYFNMSFYSLYQ